MKKAKILPSLMMLVLCVAVLALGVYAAMPVSNSVVGSIKVTASNANVRITAYLDDSDGDYSNDIAVSEEYESRTQKKIDIFDDAIKFDCTGTINPDTIPTKKLYLKVENISDFSIGAYFLEGQVDIEAGTILTNIAKTRQLSGTANGATIPEVVTADFSPYTEIGAGSTVMMYCMLTLNKVNDYEVKVELNLGFNVEKFNEALVTSKNTTNTINFANGDNLAVKTTCLIENADTNPNAEISAIYDMGWTVSNLAFAKEYYSSIYETHLRLRAVKLKMLVKNTDTVPVKVSVANGDANTAQTAINTALTGNSYIEPGKTQEVSVQFSAVYNRETAGVTTAPTISTFNFDVTIEKAETAVSVYDRIKFDSDETANSMPTKGFNYYIEFGDNPYYSSETASTQRPKLRWYVWAKDDGNGNPIALESTDKDGEKLIKGNIYYFISEYILDASSSQMGVAYQNEFLYGDYTNYNGNDCTDYAESNIRNYLKGISVKADSYDNPDDDSEYDLIMPKSVDVNLYSTYGFTNDPLYSQILARSIDNLYSTDNYLGTLPDGYSGETDVLWTLSYNEYYNLIRKNNSSNAIAYQLSQGTKMSASYWWLRSPYYNNYV